MAKTTNFGLYVTNAVDDPSFKSWRNNLAASTDGNMVRIDDALNALREANVKIEENSIGSVIWDEENAAIKAYTMTGELTQTIPIKSERDPSIEITLFENNVGFAENGSIVESVLFSMEFSQAPTSLSLGGYEIDIGNSYTLHDGNIFANAAFTLRAEDKYGNVALATSYIRFVNRVFYGVAAEPEDLSLEFAQSMNGVLTNTNTRTIDLSAGDGEYIWYFSPSALGACKFSVCGIVGGFSLVKTVSLTNSYGYTTDYNVYRSDNAGLRDITVEVS